MSYLKPIIGDPCSLLNLLPKFCSPNLLYVFTISFVFTIRSLKRDYLRYLLGVAFDKYLNLHLAATQRF
jgi:hypothetical protein